MSFKTNYTPRFNEAEGQSFTKRQLKRKFYDALQPFDCEDVTQETHLSVSRFRDTYLYQMLFSKFSDQTTGDKTRLRDNCIQKWIQCEYACKNTNYRLANGLLKPGTKIVLERAKALIADILGPFRVSYMYDECGWGPGATTRLTRLQGDPAFKFDGAPHVTQRLLPFAVAYCSDTIWQPEFVVNDCSNFMTVPKNAVTDRPIEPQPDMCLFFQKSLGNIIRRKMKGLPVDSSTTLDLNDQSVNRRLAQLGSIDGSLATVDLSSASDLISLLLVQRLLPDDWYHAFHLCRVGKTVIDGQIFALEKFSAMGNGYTWELQSLIFYAITRACYDEVGHCDYVTAVFGDDIICRSDITPKLYEVLHDVGLKVNTEKSYTTGYFRESCGRHYYKGMDVSPFFIRRPVCGSFEICKLHNRLVEWQVTIGYRDTRFRELLSELAGSIKGQPFSKPVPLGYGDCGLISCKKDLNSKPFRYRRQHVVKSPSGDYTREGHLFRGDRIVRSVTTLTNEAVLIKALFKPSLESSASEVPPYNSEWITGFSCCVSSWPELGCWL